jgi:hypothetical protein
MPAANVASERVFSIGGKIVSAKSSWLKPINVNKFIFLNKNHIEINDCFYIEHFKKKKENLHNWHIKMLKICFNDTLN